MTRPTQTLKDILALNNSKKFDVCLMNPPYAGSGDAIHLKFVDKCLDISHKQVSIYPYTFITVDNKQNNKFKKVFDKYLISVQQEDSSQFTGTHMQDVGIYKFDDNKNITDTILVSPRNSEEYNINSLMNISKFSNYESEIFDIFNNHRLLKICSGIWFPSKNKYSKQECIDILNESCKKWPKDKIYLTCNSVNGGRNGKYFTTRNGKIFDNFDSLIDSFYNSDIHNGYHVALFDTIKEAENCKIAMQNNVLRFILYRLQDNQRMTVNKCYRIPGDIDWSNPKTKTDEGLLEVCGCPKDKAKEYAEYCKKVIEEVDKK